MLDWLSVKTNRIFTFGNHKLMVSAIANHEDTSKEAYIWLAGDNGYTKSVHVTQAAKTNENANLFALNVSNSIPNNELEHETDQIGDNGQTITITSLDIPGWKFVHWKGYFIENGNISNEFQFSDPTAMSVSFTMPNSDIKIVAVFERRMYKLIVNGKLINEYQYGSEVTFTAVGTNRVRFSRWVSISGIEPPEDLTNSTIQFTMPDNTVELKYVTTDILYSVYVDTRLIGSYKPGDIVQVTAETLSSPFIKWTAEGITLTDATSMSLSFGMPENDVNLTTVYEGAKYKLIVNGTTVREYEYGEAVSYTVSSSPTASFIRWTSIDGITPPSDLTNPTMEFTMPMNNVILKYMTQDTKYNVFIDGIYYNEYRPGDIVRATAPQSIIAFIQWVAEGVTLIDPTNASLSFEMPTNDVNLRREYENKKIVRIVINGRSHDVYACFAGEAVTIGIAGDYNIKLSTLFDTSRYAFDRWSATSGIMMFNDPTSATQTFVMPDSNVSLGINLQQRFVLTIDDNQSIVQAGETITATASPPSKEGTTLEWKVLEGDVVLPNPNASTITFVMPAKNVTISSRYVLNKYTITYRSTTGHEQTQSVLYTLPVTITCQLPSNQAFDEWTSCTGIDPFDDMTNPTQSFVMPANDIVLEYSSHQVTYTLQIDGTSQQVVPGTQVTQTARSVTGRTFKKWVVVEGGITLFDDTDPELSFVMPAADVVIRSDYIVASFNVRIEQHVLIDETDTLIQTLSPISKEFESAVNLTAISAIPYTREDETQTHMRFTEWVSEDPDVTVPNETRELLDFSFIMPAHDVTLKTYYNTETYLSLRNITTDTRTSQNNENNLINVGIVEDEYGNYIIETPVPCIEFQVLTDLFGVSYEKVVSDIAANNEWDIVAVDSFGVTRAIPSDGGTNVDHTKKEYESNLVTENNIAKFGLTQTEPLTTQSRTTTFSIRNNLTDCKLVRRVTVPFIGKAEFGITVAQGQGITDTAIENGIKAIALNASTRELTLNCSTTNCSITSIQIDSNGTETEKSSNFMSGVILDNPEVSGQKIIKLSMYPNIYEDPRVLKCRVTFSTWTHGFTPTTETVEIRLTQPVSGIEPVFINRIDGSNILTINQETDPNNNSLIVYTPGNYSLTSPIAIYAFDANVPFELRTKQTNMSLYRVYKETIVRNSENEIASYLSELISDGYLVCDPVTVDGEDNTKVLTYYKYRSTDRIIFTEYKDGQTNATLYKKSATFYPTKNETQKYYFGLVILNRNTLYEGGYLLGNYNYNNVVTDHSLTYDDVFSELRFNYQDFYALTGAESFNVNVSGLNTEDWDETVGVQKSLSDQFTSLPYTTDTNGLKTYSSIEVTATGSYRAYGTTVPPWKTKVTSSLVPVYVIPTNACLQVSVIESTNNTSDWTKPNYLDSFVGTVGGDSESAPFESVDKYRVLLFAMATSTSVVRRYTVFALESLTTCEPLNALLPVGTDPRFMETKCYFKIIQESAADYGLTNIVIGGTNNHAIADNDQGGKQENIVLHKNLNIDASTVLNDVNSPDQSRKVVATYSFTTSVRILIVPSKTAVGSDVINMGYANFQIQNTTNNEDIVPFQKASGSSYPSASNEDFLDPGSYVLTITALESYSPNLGRQLGSFAIYDENYYLLKNVVIYQLGVSSKQNVLIRAMDSSKKYTVAAVYKTGNDKPVFQLWSTSTNRIEERANVTSNNVTSANANAQTTLTNPNYGFLITSYNYTAKCIGASASGSTIRPQTCGYSSADSTFELPLTVDLTVSKTNEQKTEVTKYALFAPKSLSSDFGSNPPSAWYTWNIQSSTGVEALDGLLSKNLDDPINTGIHRFIVVRG